MDNQGKLRIAIIIVLYIVVLISLPFILDCVLQYSVRNKKNEELLKIAEKLAIRNKLPLIVFTSRNSGFVCSSSKLDDKEELIGDIVEIVPQLQDNCCVIVLLQTANYIPNYKDFQKHLIKISGGKIFMNNYDSSSPRLFYDGQIYNIFSVSVALPGDIKNLTWKPPNELQKKLRQAYGVLNVSNKKNIILD